MANTNRLHWMAVGEITESAKLAIKNVNGIVRKADAGPLPIFLIGIPCNVASNERYSDVRIITWTRSEEAVVEIPSAKLKLSWSSATGVPPNDASVSDTVLDLWHEN